MHSVRQAPVLAGALSQIAELHCDMQAAVAMLLLVTAVPLTNEMLVPA
jgi:hypothetical protein